MKISVITPSLNQGVFLQETLASVRLQDYSDREHIVVDGISTDNTSVLLQSCTGDEWSHLRWVSEKDGGCTQALNKGIRMSTGDIVGWLNSDDRYRPGCLSSVARVFERHPEIDVVYGDFTFMDQSGKHLRIRREIEFNPLVLYYHHINSIPSTSAFMRKRIFDAGHYFDESLQFAMDYEFYVRLANLGYRFKHIRALLADFRLHPASKTCATGARQLAETRETMRRLSPVAQSINNRPIREICLAAMQVAAPVARYAEKLLRGYYLPDWAIEKERPIR
jgi:glycosyltransferase involved in cell wall biosynthesis